MKDFVIEASRDVRLMEAPKLFAFCCKESIDVPMNGTITYFGLDSAGMRSKEMLPNGRGFMKMRIVYPFGDITQK